MLLLVFVFYLGSGGITRYTLFVAEIAIGREVIVWSKFDLTLLYLHLVN